MKYISDICKVRSKTYFYFRRVVFLAIRLSHCVAHQKLQVVNNESAHQEECTTQYSVSKLAPCIVCWGRAYYNCVYTLTTSDSADGLALWDLRATACLAIQVWYKTTLKLRPQRDNAQADPLYRKLQKKSNFSLYFLLQKFFKSSCLIGH